jgi:uncharacterized membrane protein YhhN
VNGEAWALLAVAGVMAVANWIAVARDSKPLEYVAKPATLAALVGVALTLDPLHADTREWFVAALVLSLLGDVFLMLPRSQFIAGLVSFLLAHIAYTVGLNLHAGTATALAVASVVVAVPGIILAVPILRGLRSGEQRDFIGPVVAYMVVIAAMLASALATGNPWARGGAALFYASDAMIAWTRFVGPVRGAGVAIMVTYHLGQAGLVLSLAYT